MDHVQVAACNSYSKLSLAEQPTLALEFHGQNDGEVAEQAKFVGTFNNKAGRESLPFRLRCARYRTVFVFVYYVHPNSDSRTRIHTKHRKSRTMNYS